MKVAQQASGAAGVGEEIAAFRRALGLTVSPLAFGRPAAAVKGPAGNEERMPVRRGGSRSSAALGDRSACRLFNHVTFGIAHAFGVLPGGVLQYPGSSEVAR
jgi:hypothetical protein